MKKAECDCGNPLDAQGKCHLLCDRPALLKPAQRRGSTRQACIKQEGVPLRSGGIRKYRGGYRNGGAR